MVVCCVAGEWGVSSFTDGFRKRDEPSLEEEFRRKPEAVFNRLVRQERWEEAEQLLLLLS